jgi:hypothetical protein
MVKQFQVVVLAVSSVFKGQAFWKLMLRRAGRVVSDVSKGPSGINFIVKKAYF